MKKRIVSTLMIISCLLLAYFINYKISKQNILYRNLLENNWILKKNINRNVEIVNDNFFGDSEMNYYRGTDTIVTPYFMDINLIREKFTKLFPEVKIEMVLNTADVFEVNKFKHIDDKDLFSVTVEEKKRRKSLFDNTITMRQMFAYKKNGRVYIILNTKDFTWNYLRWKLIKDNTLYY